MTPGLLPLKQHAVAQKRRKETTMNTNTIDINAIAQAMQLMQIMQGLHQQPQVKPDTRTQDSARQGFTVVRTLRAYKATSGIYKDKWMLCAGDVRCEWRSALVPKDAFDREGDHLVTRTKWELEVGVTRTGKMFGISAKDTGVAYTKDDLDDVGAEETLDDVEPSGSPTTSDADDDGQPL